jgi:hypothetical protein
VLCRPDVSVSCHRSSQPFSSELATELKKAIGVLAQLLLWTRLEREEGEFHPFERLLANNTMHRASYLAPAILL